MKRFKQKGFTLIELLVTIVLLGVVGGIIIYNMTGLSSSSKDKEYEKFTSSVKSAAAAYADVNKEIVEQLYVDKAYIYIKVGDLIENGFLSEKTKNPYTGEFISGQEKVKASLDQSSGAVLFDYPIIETEKKETFMVALSDYVVYGEPFNCMQGIGEYKFSLSEENGDLITKDRIPKEYNGDVVKYYKEKYGFQCEVPSGFTDIFAPDDADGVERGTAFKKYIIRNKEIYKTMNDTDINLLINAMKAGNYYLTPMEGETYKSGTYEITYTWVSETGIKKQHTKTLRVLPPAKVSLEFNQEYDKDMQKHYMKNKLGDNMYSQRLIWEDKAYLPLSYKVNIDGAPNAKFSVKTPYCEIQENACAGTAYNIDNGSQDSWYGVYDGNRTYSFSYDVQGHHLENYVYSASDEYDLGTTYVPRAEYLKIFRNVENDSTEFETDLGVANYLDSNGDMIGNLWKISRNMHVETGVGNTSFKDKTKGMVNAEDLEEAAKEKLYSPTGIKEIRIYPEDNISASDLEGNGKSIKDVDRELVIRPYATINGVRQSKGISQEGADGRFNFQLNLTTGDSADGKGKGEKWRYIRYAVENMDGFISELSDPVPAYISNYLNDLLSSQCNSSSCDSIATKTINDSVGCTHTKGNYKYDRKTVSFRNIDPNKGLINFNGYETEGFIAATSAADGGKTTIVDGKTLTSTDIVTVNTVRNRYTWGVQTCDGYYTASYDQYTQYTKQVTDAVAKRCEKFAPLENNKRDGWFCNIGTNTYGVLNSSAAKEVGPVVQYSDPKCFWNDSTYTQTEYSRTEHGETKSYKNTFVSKYAYEKNSKNTKQTSSTECHVRCYLYLIPDAFVLRGNGVRIAGKADPFIVSIPNFN